MSTLTQSELQNLKHLISSREGIYKKLDNYSKDTIDPQIKQLFTKAAQDSLNTKQKLISFLSE